MLHYTVKELDDFWHYATWSSTLCVTVVRYVQYNSHSIDWRIPANYTGDSDGCSLAINDKQLTYRPGSIL